jgi:hypothetical protein
VTPPLLDAVNREVVALFAALVLLEGLRRVPAGALVMRGTGPFGWKPPGDPEPRTRWRLVSWWSPIAPALVLPRVDAAATIPTDDIQARLAVARRATPLLTACAAFTLAALIIGLPVASARYGAVGFFVGVAALFALALTNAGAGALALRRLVPPPPRTRVLAWCSPFAAGRVLEGVYEAALAGASQAQAVRALAGDEIFAKWSRARAYDALYGATHDPDLRAAADEATLRAIVAAPPADGADGVSFCRRCAATWVVREGACPACAVPLTTLVAT